MADEESLRKRTRDWTVAGQVWELGERPRIMGIVNVTPDSFSDGGQWLATGAAVDHALQLAADGADVLDIGGESTRPNSTPVSTEEELRRVIPVIEQLTAQTDVPISIDTMKAAVAREALQAGARIVNDVTALRFDDQMSEVCAASDCGVIIMHMLGTPQTMQEDPRYDDAVREISGFLSQRTDELEQAGIARSRIMVDPGIGFGKTPQHNLEILQNIEALRSFGRPVLIGHSRKQFLGKLLGRKVDDRLAGTVGISIALASQHTDMIRVHDVKAVRDALLCWERIVCGLPDRGSDPA